LTAGKGKTFSFPEGDERLHEDGKVFQRSKMGEKSDGERGASEVRKNFLSFDFFLLLVVVAERCLGTESFL
jgi:hypothetical protein